MRLLIIAIVLMMLVSPGVAVDEKSAIACTIIKNDIARLKCFDRAFADVVESQQRPTKNRTCKIDKETGGTCGDWQVSFFRSKLDDHVEPIASLQSENRVIASGHQRSRAHMIVKCQDKVTALAISTGGYIVDGAKGGFSMKYRTDKNEAETIRMNRSPNDNGVFVIGDEAIQLINKLAASKTAVFRIPIFKNQFHDAEFDLFGTSRMMRGMADACGWKIKK